MKEKELKKPFTFMVEPSLRERFVETCKDEDTTASRELRKFMRDYLKKKGQKDLF